MEISADVVRTGHKRPRINPSVYFCTHKVSTRCLSTRCQFSHSNITIVYKILAACLMLL